MHIETCYWSACVQLESDTKVYTKVYRKIKLKKSLVYLYFGPVGSQCGKTQIKDHLKEKCSEKCYEPEPWLIM